MPKMLGLEGQEVHQSNLGWSPVYVEDNLGVMSIGFLLSQPDDAIIWRGPRKNSIIKSFLKDTYWGEEPMDVLIVDAPPGTSDEHISIVKLLENSHPGAALALTALCAAYLLKPCSVSCCTRCSLHPRARTPGLLLPPALKALQLVAALEKSAASADGALIVTTPQDVAIIDVRKEVSFCKKSGLPVLGVVENMAGLHMPLTALTFRDNRGADISAQVLASLPDELRGALATCDVFAASKGGGEAMARELGTRFLGRVPLDPELSRVAESGGSLQDLKGSTSLPAFNSIVDGVPTSHALALSLSLIHI